MLFLLLFFIVFIFRSFFVVVLFVCFCLLLLVFETYSPGPQVRKDARPENHSYYL